MRQLSNTSGPVVADKPTRRQHKRNEGGRGSGRTRIQLRVAVCVVESWIISIVGGR